MAYHRSLKTTNRIARFFSRGLKFGSWLVCDDLTDVIASGENEHKRKQWTQTNSGHKGHRGPVGTKEQCAHCSSVSTIPPRNDVCSLSAIAMTSVRSYTSHELKIQCRQGNVHAEAQPVQMQLGMCSRRPLPDANKS